MSEYIVSIVLALIGATGGIGAFVLAWQSRKEQRRLLAAQAEKTEAEADEIEVSAASKLFINQQDQITWQGKEIEALKARIAELESDKRDRLAEMAQLYETLMSALGRNRYLESERARILQFLRSRYPEVYKVYRAECGEGLEDDERASDCPSM